MLYCADRCCLQNHSNKICLITLAPTHPVIADNLKVTNVNFEVSKKLDRKSNKTSGKSKKGGQLLDPASLLARDWEAEVRFWAEARQAAFAFEVNHEALAQMAAFFP